MALGNLSDKRKDVWCGGKYLVKWFQTGTADIKAGYVVAEDDADEVKICPTSGIPAGVSGALPWIDLDTLFSAGISIPVFPIGLGALLMIGHDATVEAIAKGELCITSATVAGTAFKGTTAGRVVGIYQETLSAGADQWIQTLV